MTLIASLLAGLVFGLGLLVSGMANPAKVLGFLDIAGAWDPSLAFVMVGAIAVGFVAFRLARQRALSFLGAEMRLSNETGIDARLIVGNTLFGIGWGIAGFCPAPAVVAVGTGSPRALVFVVAMLAGMAIFEFIERRRRPALSGT